MAASTALVSVEEYLSTTCKPACQYIDGVLRQKPMPTRKHSFIQGLLAYLLLSRFSQFEADPELTVQIRPGKFLVPDLAVQSRDHIQDPYPTAPVHLCVEILSPDDRISEVFAKCEDYLAWGVPVTWIIDPESKRAWEFRRGQRPAEVPPAGSLTAEVISIPLAGVFSEL